MRFRYLLLLILLLFAFGNCRAQSWLYKLPIDWDIHLGGGYFTAGNLKRMADAQGVKGFPSLGLDMNIGLGYRLGKVSVGANFGNLQSKRSDNQTNVNTITAFVATNIWHVGRWTFSPAVGVGPQIATIVLDRGDLTGNFEEYISEKGNQTRLQQINTALDFSLTFKTYELLTARYRPQFRMGYQTGLSNAAWKVGNTSLINAPRDRTGMFYLQISAGIGR